MMTTNNKATLPDLADHMDKMASKIQGQYTLSAPKYQPTHCMSDAFKKIIARLDRIGRNLLGVNYDNCPH